MCDDYGSITLCIRCVTGCADSALTELYTATPEGRYEWSHNLIPILYDPSSIDPSRSDIKQIVSTAQAFSTIKIGRRPNCTIRLQDPSISGYHCKLIVVRAAKLKRSLSEDGLSFPYSGTSRMKDLNAHSTAMSSVACYLIDQSTNGTFIDNTRAPKELPVLISSNQVISLGRGKLDSDGETSLHTFAFTASVLRGTPSGVVELEEASISARNDIQLNSPILTTPSDVIMSFAARILQTETQCPWSTSASRNINLKATPQIETTYQVMEPSESVSSHNNDFISKVVLKPLRYPPESTLYRSSEAPESQTFFQSPSPPNPTKASPPSTLRRMTSNIRYIKSVPTSCPSMDSQMATGHTASGGLRSASSTNTGGGKLADLVKRLQDESIRKGEEITEIAVELENSEASRQQLISDLNEAVLELEQVKQGAESKTQLLCQQVEQLSQKNGSLEKGLREMENWKRQAENLETQTSVIRKRLERTTSQLEEVQSSRDIALQKLQQKIEQVEELEITSQQTAVLLESSRAEVDSLNKKLTDAETFYAASLCSTEHELETTRSDLLNEKNKIRDFEMEVKQWEIKKKEWEKQRSQLVETQGILEIRLKDIVDEAQQLKRIVREMQERSVRVSVHLKAALDLSLEFEQNELNGITETQNEEAPQTTQPCNSFPGKEDERQEIVSSAKLFQESVLFSMSLPTQGDQKNLTHPIDVQDFSSPIVLSQQYHPSRISRTGKRLCCSFEEPPADVARKLCNNDCSKTDEGEDTDEDYETVQQCWKNLSQQTKKHSRSPDAFDSEDETREQKRRCLSSQESENGIGDKETILEISDPPSDFPCHKGRSIETVNNNQGQVNKQGPLWIDRPRRKELSKRIQKKVKDSCQEMSDGQNSSSSRGESDLNITEETGKQDSPHSFNSLLLKSNCRNSGKQSSLDGESTEARFSKIGKISFDSTSLKSADDLEVGRLLSEVDRDTNDMEVGKQSIQPY